MKNPTPLRRMGLGYFLLILLVIIQELLLYWHVVETQQFTGLDLLLCVAVLAALLLGFLLPSGVTTVVVFIFAVGYFVWLSTFAPVNVMSVSWMILIPANASLAAFIKTSLIRSGRFIERLEALKTTNPDLDLDTALGNKTAFNEVLIKHTNLARRYPEKYSFCIAMFKMDFLPLVQESLGSKGYSQLLLELSGTIQKQIRYEDYKFFIGQGRYIVLCPLTRPDYLRSLTKRVKEAMMAHPFLEKDGSSLKLVVRVGALVFQQDQFDKYSDIDAVIAALERNTETDLIGEYI